MTHWLLILLGIASTFGVLLLDWMLCTPFPGYGFEAPGMGWILCVGLYNGTLLGCALALFHDAIVSAKSDRLKAVSGLAVCTLVTTLLWWSNPNTCGDNLRDQLVRRIGYCFFYVPLFSKQPVDDRPLSPNISVAIRPHNRVTAITSNGVLKITAGNGSARTCLWDFGERTVAQKPINAARRRDVDPNWTGLNCLRLNGATRISYLEEEMDFNGSGPALAFVYGLNNQALPLSYNKTGLVIGWTKTGMTSPETIEIVVFQLLINGKKPSDLLGGDDTKVAVEISE